jgi:hypothetical protein
MLKVIIALVLIAHGIGHTMGPLQVFRLVTINPQWHGDSWLLTAPLGVGLAQGIGMILWLVALVGFVALGAVMLGWAPAAWWQPVAIGASVASLVAIGIFPSAFPAASTVGAIAVDIGVLVGVLWLNWTPVGATA